MYYRIGVLHLEGRRELVKNGEQGGARRVKEQINREKRDRVENDYASYSFGVANYLWPIKNLINFPFNYY